MSEYPPIRREVLVDAGPEAAFEIFTAGLGRWWPLAAGKRVARPGEDDGAQTWVALLHRPGPSAPQDGSLFDDPRFAGHVAFLNRMREAGYLIAAGPLADEDGAGMTILRLPGADRLGDAAALATKDDAAVVGGLLSVTVRPWQVMMSVLTPAP